MSYGGPAQAQSKCDAAKLKEYGKRVFCLAKVDAKAAKKGEPIDTAKQLKCIDKFDDKCAKAEAGDDCTLAVKDCAELVSEADACRAAGVGSGEPVCCEGIDSALGAQVCGNATNADHCTSLGGTAAAAGTVCNFDTDSCVSPPPASTGCCDVGGGLCLTWDLTGCSTLVFGTHFPSLVCTPTGCATP
jgi:hypothetical protein